MDIHKQDTSDSELDILTDENRDDNIPLIESINMPKKHTRSPTFGNDDRGKFNRRISILQSFQENNSTEFYGDDDEIAAKDEDFVFIDEVISGIIKDMAERETLQDVVQAALQSNINLSAGQKDNILTQVESQSENLNKAIEFAGQLLKSVKSTKEALEEEIN